MTVFPENPATPTARRGLAGLSPAGLGCAQLGNLYTAIDDTTAEATVAAAWDAGVRYFDTAPHYGLGLSERRLGAALRGRPRDSFVVSTKVGRLLEPSPATAGSPDPAGFVVPATHRRVWDFSAEGVLRSLTESLDRLGLDRVDLVLIHDPEDHAKEALESAYPALHALRDEGVVRAVGVGSIRAEILDRFAAETDVDAVLVAGRYTLLEQPALDAVIPACRSTGVRIVAAAVFNSGLLSTPRPGGRYEYGEAPPALLARARRIADVCDRHGVALPEAALQFPLREPAVRSVVVGGATPAHVRENARRMRAEIPEALWDDLAAKGLVRT